MKNKETKYETHFIIDNTRKYYSIILRIGVKNIFLFRLIKEYISVANEFLFTNSVRYFCLRERLVDWLKISFSFSSLCLFLPSSGRPASHHHQSPEYISIKIYTGGL